MLDVHTDRIGDVTVVACSSDFDVRQDISKLRDIVRRESDSRLLVLDFSKVELITSEQLGALSTLDSCASKYEVDVKLFNLPLSLNDQIEEWRSRAGSLEIVPLERFTDLIVLAQNARREGAPHLVDQFAA
jgi:hypothetical protein